MLELRAKAPDFALQDKDGNIVRLSDYLGKRIVLYFYPRDNTPAAPVRPAPSQAHMRISAISTPW